jgi:hypothetical protein
MLTSEKSMAGNRVRYSVMLLLLSQGWTPCIKKKENKRKYGVVEEPK